MRGGVTRRQLLGYVPRMISGRMPTDDPKIRAGRCRRVAVRSEAPLVAHTDGEFFCRPEDGVRELETHILPGALRVRGRPARS